MADPPSGHDAAFPACQQSARAQQPTIYIGGYVPRKTVRQEAPVINGAVGVHEAAVQTEVSDNETEAASSPP